MRTYEGYRRLKGGWAPSEAQRRVLDELAAGRTNAEIAARLGLSAGTVKWHVAQLLGESGCADRAALGRWWRDQRECPPRAPLLVPLLRLVGGIARLGVGAAALGLGLLLLIAGVAGAPRLLERLEVWPRLVGIARPTDPAPPPAVQLAAHLLWTADGSPDGLSHPRSIAADAMGNVYVKDARNHRIVKFGPDGRVLTHWGSAGSGPGQFLFLKNFGAGGYPGAVAVAPDGTVYVSDYSGRVQHFDADGRYLGAWGNRGTGPGQLEEPNGMAFDARGRLYITDYALHRVQVFDRDGTLRGAWGTQGTGPGEFDSPAAIAVAPDGSVYVSDTRNHRVQRFAPDGRYVGTLGREGVEPGQFFQTAGVAVGTDGTVYVGERGRNIIQVFAASGRYLGEWGNPTDSPADRQFTTIGQLALDGQGNIYIADLGGRRIHKFRLP